MSKRLFATIFFLLGTCAVFGAEGPETTETLTSKLSEALQQSDWPKISLVAEAFRKAEVKDSDLELAVLYAERDAVLNAEQTGSSGQLKALGQAARFLAGNRAAIEVLHKWAYTSIPDVPARDPALWADHPEEAIAYQKTLLQAFADRELQQFAFVALAHLKDPDLPAKALAALKEFNVDATNLGAYHIIEALLITNTEDDLQRLLEMCANPDTRPAVQAEILSALFALSDPNLFANGAVTNLRIANEFRGKLPKDLRAQVVNLYIGFIQRFTPDTLNQNVVWTVVSLFTQLAPDSRVITALKGFRARTQNAALRQQIGALIKQQRSVGPKDF